MKIKLPLRVIDANQLTMPIWVKDANNNLIGSFPDQQTAQLFADCFSIVSYWRQAMKSTDFVKESYMNEIEELAFRAAEAVEE